MGWAQMQEFYLINNTFNNSASKSDNVASTGKMISKKLN
jgi:hypothetical protein